MADWFPIPDAAVDPDAPITSELGYAFRDNPIAIAEGAMGAPRVRRAALQSWSLIGNLSASGTTPVAFTNLGGVRALKVLGQYNGNSAAGVPQASISTDGGSTWGAYFAISPSTPTATVVETYINSVIGQAFSRTSSVSSIYNGYTFTATPDMNAIRFRISTTSVGGGGVNVFIFADGNGAP